MSPSNKRPLIFIPLTFQQKEGTVTVSSLFLVHWPFLEISGPQKWAVGVTLVLKQNFLAGTLYTKVKTPIKDHSKC